MVLFWNQVLIVCMVAIVTFGNDLNCPPPPKYHISRNPNTWMGAVEYCNQRGMRLVELDSEEKQKEVVHLVESSQIFNSTSTRLWIGASDLGRQQHFVWHGFGRELTKDTYSNWAPNEPNNGGSNANEHCAEMRKNFGWKWNDWECNKSSSFVCEQWLPSPFWQ